MARIGTEAKLDVFRGNNAEIRATAFESLYRDNFDRVYNYVCYRMASSAEAEDITAEAFLKAARSFDRFDARRAKFSTWVITIARNCISDHWRKQRWHSTLDDIPEEAVSVKDEYPALNEDAELAQRLLAVLDDSDRELVYLKYFEGKHNVEIARELDMNESTISTRLSRALAKMRAAL